MGPACWPGSVSRFVRMLRVFFFQAEDGIRDVAVTGVQTCALPISMTRFESRPARTGQWEYYFYIDLEGHPAQPNVASALEELRGLCAFYKVLGTYPRSEEHTSELQSRLHLVCRLLLEKKNILNHYSFRWDEAHPQPPGVAQAHAATSLTLDTQDQQALALRSGDVYGARPPPVHALDTC